jgi:hypothetical protein
MPRDPYVRDKFTREIQTARQVAREYLKRYPKDLFETEVESWADIQYYNIEFVMQRLREPRDRGNEGLSDQPWSIFADRQLKRG